MLPLQSTSGGNGLSGDTTAHLAPTTPRPNSRLKVTVLFRTDGVFPTYMCAVAAHEKEQQQNKI